MYVMYYEGKTKIDYKKLGPVGPQVDLIYVWQVLVHPVVPL